MTTSCAFCRRDRAFAARTFYETDRWFGFLAAPPNIRGHAILAVKSTGACPQTLDRETLRDLDAALGDITAILTAHYRPKRVLFASLRAKDPHIHLHVFPVSEEDEQRWRQEKGEGYETGRFFEFLGEQEKAVNLGLRIEVLDTDVESLRQLSRSVPDITTSPMLPDE